VEQEKQYGRYESFVYATMKTSTQRNVRH